MLAPPGLQYFVAVPIDHGPAKVDRLGISAIVIRLKVAAVFAAFFTRLHVLFSSFLVWCRRWDSNPHGQGPRDFKSRASANSATPASTIAGRL